MSATNQPITALLTTAYATWNVSSVTDLATGGVHNELPEAPTYPCVRLWARGNPVGAFGFRRVWECDLEAWIYSLYQGDSEALAIGEQLIALMAPGGAGTFTLADGWSARIVTVSDLFLAGVEDLNGRQVREWVASFHARIDRG